MAFPARIAATAASLLACALLCLTPAAAQDAAPAPPPDTTAASSSPGVIVLLQTSLGEVQVEVDVVHTPVTAQNFLRYVDAKRFDGTTIYRAVKITEDGKYGLVQGGVRGDRKRAFPPIAHEAPAATGLSHRDGAISMAREAPGTASGDFFFIVGDLVSLDGNVEKQDPGYAVFGRVTGGMDIVRSVLDLPRSEKGEEEVMKGQMLAEPVMIVSARRATASP